MHDRFDILGLPSNARARDVRLAWARRTHRTHPDFFEFDSAAVPRSPLRLTRAPGGAARDAAVDFVHMGGLLDRVQAAFFADPHSSHA